MTSYTMQGNVISRQDGQPVPHAIVNVFNVTRVGSGFNVNLVTSLETDTGGSFKGSFSAAVPQNIIFRVQQKVNGVIITMYNEIPAINTRWNVANVVYNILKVDNCVSAHPPVCPQHQGNYFIFTRVGNIKVQDISQTTGYARPFPPPPGSTLPTTKSMDSNQPFGGTISIAGWFGKDLINATHMEYYKIQYTPGIHLPTDTVPWTDISDTLKNDWYDNSVGKKMWVPVQMGPTTMKGVHNVYQLPKDPDHIPWNFPDLLATWDTTKVAEGIYTVRVMRFDDQAAPGSANQVVQVPCDSAYGTLKVLTDNVTPECVIKKIRFQKTGSATPVDIDPCAFIDLKSDPIHNIPEGGKIYVDFDAFDSMGHLRCFVLDACYGHSKIVVPRPITANINYSSQPGPLWNGSQTNTAEYDSNPPAANGYTKTEMPKCAYQFRLRVDKRTTNGFGLVYWGYEDTFHVTIDR